MDVAYDHIQENSYPKADEEGKRGEKSSEDKPQPPSLNEDFQEAYKAFSSSPWGSKIGGFFGTVKKQVCRAKGERGASQTLARVMLRKEHKKFGNRGSWKADLTLGTGRECLHHRPAGTHGRRRRSYPRVYRPPRVHRQPHALPLPNDGRGLHRRRGAGRRGRR